MARAALTTATPSASSACRTPSRSVTCSKLPAGIERTRTTPRQLRRWPAEPQPARRPIAKPQAAKIRPARRVSPSRSSAARSRAPVPALGPPAQDQDVRRAPSPNDWASSSGAKRPAGEGAAGVERGHQHPRRAEQHRVDLVEIVPGILEDPGERLAVVARGRARQLLRQLARLGLRPGHEQLHLAAEQDRVVGPAHGGEEIGRGRRQRRAAQPVAHALQRKAQRVDLVQRHLQHARGDLHRAGEARGRGQDEGQAPRVRGRSRRRPARSARPAAARSVSSTKKPQNASRVGVAELLEQLLLGRTGPAGPGGHGEVGAVALAVAQAPAGILAGEAGQHRIAGGDADAERPVRERASPAPSVTRPSPPMQISAIRRPASMPARGSDAAIDDRGPGARCAPRRAAARRDSRSSLATSGWASRPTLGHRPPLFGCCPASLIAAPPASRASDRADSVGRVDGEASVVATGRGCRSARPASRSRTVGDVAALGPARCRSGRRRAILVPGGLRSAAQAGQSETDRHRPSDGPRRRSASRPRRTGARRTSATLPPAGRHVEREQVEPERARSGVERGARSGVDLQHGHRVAIHQRIDAAQADQAEMRGQGRGRRFQTAPRASADSMAGAAAPANRNRRPGSGALHCSLQPSTRAVPAVADHQRRDRPARAPGAASTSRGRWRARPAPRGHARRRRRRPACTASRGGRPAAQADLRMGDAEPGRGRGEAERVLDRAAPSAASLPQQLAAGGELGQQRPADARTPSPRPAGSAAAPAWPQPRAAAGAAGASAGRPAPAARPPRPRACRGRRRRRARSARSRRARADCGQRRGRTARRSGPAQPAACRRAASNASATPM